jgi:hypothetical protein
MHEPFDAFEARRIIEEARAVEDEFSDLPGWGRRVGEDREERERLALLCSKRALLWSGIAAGLDARDMGEVRASAEAVRQGAEDAFRRLWDDDSGGGVHRDR